MTLVYPKPIVEANGRQIADLMSFSLSVDLLQDSDDLEFSVPPSVYKQIRLDDVIKMRFGISGNVQFTGRIYKIAITDNGLVKVTCFDQKIRLVDESVKPNAGVKIGRETLGQSIKAIVQPFFKNVIFSNAADRILRRQSRRGQARSLLEPISRSEYRALRGNDGGFISGGTKRIRALKRILEPFGLLSWSSADGKSLIVAEPNYRQRTQYEFIRSPRDSNVLSMDASKSIQGRYSNIIVSGSARGQGTSAPVAQIPGVPKRPRIVLHSLGIARDTSGDFQDERTLFVRDTSIFPEAAQRKAEKLLGQQIGSASPVTVEVAGFGQRIKNGNVLYAPDTIAKIKRSESDFRTGEEIFMINASYYVTSVDFSLDENSGPQTRLQLVPSGTPLI